MKPVGSVLMVAGVSIGIAVGIAILAGVSIPNIPWIIGVGLAKLVILSALCLIGAGAMLHRLGTRAENRNKLATLRSRGAEGSGID